MPGESRPLRCGKEARHVSMSRAVKPTSSSTRSVS